MRINHKILSIPPYISTSWKNIASIHVEMDHGKPVVVIGLNQGKSVKVPELESVVIEAIFAAHAKYLEQGQTKVPEKAMPSGEVFGINLPIQLGDQNMEGLVDMMHHNPEQSNAPKLPDEILNKIVAITKALGIEDTSLLPNPEPNCNCMHCQVAKAFHQEVVPTIDIDEEVSSDDLKFRTWDINQTTDKLYLVTNPLDDKEQYNVFLGEPMGCTCGDNHCEHIRAVLST